MEKIKKRIKRVKPNKKWTDGDIKTILNYLQEAPEIEAPTAQIFYKELIARSNIDATWELIRWKVRHLKASFKKANDWRKSTGAALHSDAETSSVEAKVLHMCPHYKQLNEIFGVKTLNGDFTVIDSGDMMTRDDSIKIEFPDPLLSPLLVDTADLVRGTEEAFSISPPADFSDIRGTEKSSPSSSSSMQASAIFPQSVPTNVPKQTMYFAGKSKCNAAKSSAAHLAAFQAERAEIFKIRLEWEKEKHEKELALRDRKLKLEEEKVKHEIYFKLLELEKEERLKILEMEKDERLQKFEIEMKYKSQSQR